MVMMEMVMMVMVMMCGNGNIDNGNPNLNNGNQGNSNLTQTPINNNYYNPVYNAIRQLGLTNNIMNELLSEIANESIDEHRKDLAWVEQHNAKVDENQEMREQSQKQITKWLKHARFRRTLMPEIDKRIEKKN